MHASDGISHFFLLVEEIDTCTHKHTVGRAFRVCLQIIQAEPQSCVAVLHVATD